MRDIFAAIVTAAFASTILFFWYHEMFSDGPVGEFSRSFNNGRGKNFTALTQPVFIVLNISASMTFITGVFTSRSAREVARMNSPWRVWALFWSIMCILALLVLAISFIPFTLPEWMYPEYHAAKREEQRRREAAERGEIEDRNPLLDDNGAYASQLGNVPTDIPETSGLPSTTAPRSLQAVPSAEGPPPPHGAPEAGVPALHGPDVATSDAGTANALDITAAIASLPRTGTPTSHGARPARASRARRGHGGAATTPTGTREDPNGDA